MITSFTLWQYQLHVPAYSTIFTFPQSGDICSPGHDHQLHLMAVPATCACLLHHIHVSSVWPRSWSPASPHGSTSYMCLPTPPYSRFLSLAISVAQVMITSFTSYMCLPTPPYSRSSFPGGLSRLLKHFTSSKIQWSRCFMIMVCLAGARTW